MSKEHCDRCDGEIEEYESLGAYEDMEICTECWYELHFFCCLCQSETPEHQRGEIGNCIVVTHAKESGVKIGLYEIVEHPYYYYGYIVMNLYKDAIRYIGPIPNGIDTEGYPMGHLCNECSSKLKSMETTQCIPKPN